MASVYLLVSVCLAVLGTSVNSHSTSAATTAAPSVGEMLLEKMERLDEKLDHKLNLMHKDIQSSCSAASGGSGQDQSSATTTTLMLEAMQTKLTAMEKQQQVTDAAMQTMEKHHQVTEEAMQMKLMAMEKQQQATNATMQTMEKQREEMEKQQAARDSAMQAMKTDLEATSTALQSAQTLLNSRQKSGSTFVRWGRKTCTNSSQLVYTGVAGGSSHKHSGAAANLLCLTLNPQTDGTPFPSYYTYLYGSEYDYVPGHHDQDVPCSVCLATQSSTIMVPGTLTCPSGWTAQYTGHLVAGYYTHPAATEYNCLDGHPENRVNGHLNHDGNLMYFVFSQCGSLPCPPYTNNKIVTCTVCSK